MIRQATEQDIHDLKALWELCFHDPLNYVDFIYNKVANPMDTMVFDTGSKIVSMLTGIPVRFVFDDQALPAVYIYGVATHPKFRNRGLASQMMSVIEEDARNRDCALALLVPGEEHLFRYYHKLGYNADFNLRAIPIRAGMIGPQVVCDTDLKIDTISCAQLYALRESCLAVRPHIEWSAQQLEFVIEDARLYGEHTAHYVGVSGEAYAIYGVGPKRSLYIKECLGSSEEARLVLIKTLIQDTNPARVSLQQPVHSLLFPHEGATVRFGMAKSLQLHSTMKDIEPYMNLMLN